MKYYLFDFDGTLCNTNEGVIKSVEYALDKMGVVNTLTHEQMEPMFIGPPLTESFPYFFGENREAVLKAIYYFRERYNTLGVKENKLFDGVRDMLSELKARDRSLYICSSKPIGFIQMILKEHGIGGYFDGVFAPSLDEDKLTKYDVIMLAKKQILDADPEPVIYMVGDRKYDVMGAHQANLECIGVKWGCAEPGEFEACGTEYTVSSVKELLELDTEINT
ncbi:MAG: HAD hydrolase-like protein [Clostridia bacterium]|nr:HAD hydrolase-like protein [Clostridia bacterium]